jgi:hypothetical protein
MPVIVEGISAPQLGVKIEDWIRRKHIEIAERVLVQQVAKGFDREPVVITDGQPRRDYRQVKPFGKIEFVRRTEVADAVTWALARLRQLSPVGPPEGGHYRDDHIVLVNGQQVTGDLRAALMAVRPGEDRVQIVNPRPYARKIEGATASRRTKRQKRRALSRQARGGVYRVVLRELVQRFSRTLFFDFKYVQLNTGLRVWGRQGGSSSRRVLRNQVFPCIQIFKNSGGGS